MKTIAWLFLAGTLLARSQAARPESETRVAVTLADGSQFVAPAPAETLSIKTEYGEQRIPMKDVRSLRRVSESEFQIQTASFSTTGEVARKELEFQTELGKFKVPLAEIRIVASSLSLSALTDPNTVAAWAFGDDRGGACFDLVKGRRLELREMDSSTDRDGVGMIARRNENSYAEATAVEDLDIAGDFTIEARFLAGTTTRGYSGILSRNDGTTGQMSDFSVFTHSTGQLQFQSLSNRGNVSFSTPQPVVKPSEWSYVAIVIQPQVPLITVFVNGKQVHQHRQVCRSANTGAPLFLGTSPPYQSSFACAEKIQFVRFSKVARRPDEIAELQEALASGGGFAGPASARGVALRSGGFLRATFPTLSGAKFKTRYGSLTFGESSAGQLTLCRFRENELERVKEEAKALVQQLGCARVEEREEAAGKLLKLAEAAVAALKEGAQDSDSEIRRRSEAMLKKFDATGVTPRPVADVYRSGQTVLHGWLDAESVEVATKFGTFYATVRSVERINLGDRPVKSKTVVRLRSGEAVQGETAKQSAVRLDTGFGTLSIPLAEVTSLTFDAAKAVWTARTERVSATGKLAEEDVRIETPAGPVDVPVSEIAQISSP